jgi:FkbM family methyltransferase
MTQSIQPVNRVVAGAKDWPGLLRALRWRMARALTPRRVVYARGLRFTLQCDNWITHYRWQTFNDKEPETLDWIDGWLRDGDLFFDIGANVGVYTIYAAVRHPRIRVVAFEPEYANLHALRDNLFGNRLQERVGVYALGLSDQSGVSWLHIQELKPGAALHTESREHLEQTLTGRPVIWREGICIMTMDAFCAETGLQPDGIKIDVDGTEARILAGAAKTLRLPSLRSVILELPADVGARQTCERLLTEAGLRSLGAPARPLANQVWVRS